MKACIRALERVMESDKHVQHGAKLCQVLPFPGRRSSTSDPQFRSLIRTLKLLREIRSDLNAMESEWIDQWDAWIRHSTQKAEQ